MNVWLSCDNFYVLLKLVPKKGSKPTHIKVNRKHGPTYLIYFGNWFYEICYYVNVIKNAIKICISPRCNVSERNLHSENYRPLIFSIHFVRTKSILSVTNLRLLLLKFTFFFLRTFIRLISSLWFFHTDTSHDLDDLNASFLPPSRKRDKNEAHIL